MKRTVGLYGCMIAQSKGQNTPNKSNHGREAKWIGKVSNTLFYFILLTLLQKTPLLTYGAKLVHR